ncbi:MAG: tRNA (adenosine(37)-N6)-threonylcarbamoyltransferase complex ATPase subunit type 1 TsaE [Lachnospiraceae bacterium]|jgi:tRNA threonylcarbamoyladenosine biosynthesis protein TsaE|nr:tRNA (adenosine(37)-N6)-threonylcarbamoyltransferase complex ATPase subunit type 1 TsaE [Lachnospiraceae bacterium]MBQ8666381.1 tRNA (adenosine(37)-N6)-threonylcarbamoyltransferase complex ATPase subunit type 1 TsaE [Lachnospiraceae bacterium]MBR1450103.1 tRNA (adenosine(37)-N6)-threonylcarbamoyltransferase complex ATPase subunit type 1 TsaE [Lachnospiraceae bacterium]
MVKKIESYSEKDTFDTARKLAEVSKKGDIYALVGDLGVGKTAFAKGFAEGLGIRESIVSPTFTILQIYESGRMPLYHFDVYRIGDVSEMDEIGYEDCFWGDGVSLVEWADIVRDIFPENTVKVTIEKDLSKGVDYRMITIESNKDEDNSH